MTESEAESSPDPKRQRTEQQKTSAANGGSAKSSSGNRSNEEIEREAKDGNEAKIIARIFLHSGRSKPTVSQNLLQDQQGTTEFVLEGVNSESSLSEVKEEIDTLLQTIRKSDSLPTYKLVEKDKFNGNVLFTRPKRQKAANSIDPNSLKMGSREEAVAISTDFLWKWAVVTVAFRQDVGETANRGSDDESFDEDSQQGSEALEAIETESFYLDIIAIVEKNTQATVTPNATQKSTRKVPDEETELFITLHGPAYKDKKTETYSVESKSPPDSASKFKINAPGPGKERVSGGYITRMVKNSAAAAHYYKDKSGNCIVGEKSSVMMQENKGMRRVSFIAADLNESKVSTDVFWSMVNKQRNKMSGSASEKKRVEIVLCVGAKKDDDVEYTVTEGDSKLAPMDEDAGFSQSVEAAAFNSPAGKGKMTAEEMRDDQDNITEKVPEFLDKIFEKQGCEFYHALTKEHYEYYLLKLRVKKFGNEYCYEKWTLDDDDEEMESWPKIADFPIVPENALGHDKPIETNAYPKINNQYQRFKLTEDEKAKKLAEVNAQAIATACTAAMKPIADTLGSSSGKPTNNLHFEVYREDIRNDRGSWTSFNLKIDKNITLDDVYNHDQVKQRIRKWPPGSQDLAGLVADTHRVRVKLTNEQGTKIFLEMDAVSEQLKQYNLKDLVADCPVEGLNPVHFVLYAARNVNVEAGHYI